jgi:hypothetical protein
MVAEDGAETHIKKGINLNNSSIHEERKSLA